MSVNDAYSHTSNVSKLLKHLDRLQRLQQGRAPAPIMVHTMPTHRCQLKCEHCCFRNRENLVMDMELPNLMRGIRQFADIGTRAVEFTGGGEPLLYPHLPYAIEVFHEWGLSIGLITNGLAAPRIADVADKLRWVRLSLNTLDYRDEAELQPAADILRPSTHLSACYIWNSNGPKNLQRVFEFCQRNRLPCRISPDCIQSLTDIDLQLATIRDELSTLPTNDFLFLSDFNTTLTRRNANCYIHLIKPALYTDGYVYPCPSAELALEHDKQIDQSARLCHATEVYDFYRTLTAQPLQHACSYCKYSKQQDLLEDLLMETDFNEFA